MSPELRQVVRQQFGELHRIELARPAEPPRPAPPRLAAEAWQLVREHAEQTLTLMSRIASPLSAIEPVTVREGALVLTAPHPAYELAERYWADWIDEAVRTVSELRGAVLTPRPMEGK